MSSLTKKIYIAGPMRGHENWNFLAFDTAEKHWSAEGWHVFNPAAMCRALGYAHFEDGRAIPSSVEGRRHVEHVIRGDIDCIMMSDALAVLPGWESSRGATVEVAVALFLGMPILCAWSGQPIQVTGTPWRVCESLGQLVKDK